MNYQTDWMAKQAAEKILFYSKLNSVGFSAWTYKWNSPMLEASVLKGIPANNDGIVADLRYLFSQFKKEGHFKGKRLTIRYRGPRGNNRHTTPKANAQSVSVYIHDAPRNYN